MVVFGWDVSTTMIGACAIDLETGVNRGYWALPIVGETMFEKYDSALVEVETVLLTVDDVGKAHFVEDRLGNFSTGMTTMQTLMKLAQMNAVVSHYLSRFGPVTHLHPATAKRIAGLKVPKGGDKKAHAVSLAAGHGGLVVKLTAKGNHVKGTEDMADAYLLAASGLRILRGEARLDETKKARGSKKKAGELEL